MLEGVDTKYSRNHRDHFMFYFLLGYAFAIRFLFEEVLALPPGSFARTEDRRVSDYYKADCDGHAFKLSSFVY